MDLSRVGRCDEENLSGWLGEPESDFARFQALLSQCAAVTTWRSKAYHVTLRSLYQQLEQVLCQAFGFIFMFVQSPRFDHFENDLFVKMKRTSCRAM